MSWLWWVQIAADVVLLAVLFMLLSRLKGGGGGAGAGLGQAPAEARRFVAEAQRLTGEFDRILNEKRELIGTTLKGLDARIAKLQQMAADLEQAAQAAPPPPPAEPEPDEPQEPADDGLAAFRQKVLELSRQGKGAAQIAESTGRPRGEVELVLGLSARSG